MENRECQEVMTPAIFQTWTVCALQDYVFKRGLKKDGTKAMLVARAFAAWEMGIPLNKTQQEIIEEKEKEYSTLLSTSSGQLPNPLLIKDGWVGESEGGVKKWPPIYFNDICQFVMVDHPGRNVDFTKRMLNEYKEGKAYRYFQAEWMKEIFLLDISTETEYVFLRANCTPSQRIGCPPHHCWICVKRDGSIHSAYCTCTAGLGETCSHVTALLFRVEAANRTGMTNLSCTELKCKWNVPKKKTEITPLRVKEMDFKQAKYNASGDKKRKLVDSKKRLFSPLHERHQASSAEKQNLYQQLRESVPRACLFTMIEEPSISMTSDDPEPGHGDNTTIPDCGAIAETSAIPNSENDTDLPGLDDRVAGLQCTEAINLISLAKVSTNEDRSLESNLRSFLSLFPKYSEDDINMIESYTRLQNQSVLWHDVRAGRITSSNFYSVYTRVNTLRNDKSNRSKDTTSLVARLMGYRPVNPDLPALKHGRNMEPVAKQNYTSILSQNHRNVTSRECGIFIDRNRPYLAATPDLLVSCECCGQGHVEIKCPRSIAHIAPGAGSPDYLVTENEKVTLKHNHSYYAQIQGQMGVTGHKWCDFFVYTSHGYHLERIEFDQSYWINMLERLDYFFFKYIAVELITGKVKRAL
ncbi:uncharacterized protein [Ptychodera flava]|uniref:uncharacterized protein n=1 Tax=Ptychodera flava TaxID=63121 RepID=UPI003969E059